ncbi:MAG: phage tail tape measure protein, partial [Candidatus Omnitrophota bacterium]
EPFAKATDTILKIDAALAALVAGGMYLAIKSSSEFNQQFALISTSVTATGQDLDRYRTDILSYSTESVKATSDINSALYTAAQAGIQWGESLDFMRKSEQLAVANNANLNTTVDLLTGTMNAYGFTLKDVGHLNDVFFESTLIGKQTIDDLGISMGLVVGIAATAGVSFEELSAAISTLTAKGMTTENAITAVKNVITSIINPSKESADAAAALGLNFSASAIKSKSFSEIMKEVMVATGGSADQMVKLFGDVRAMNGAFMLTNDSMSFFNTALEKINNSAGVAEAAYQKMAVTFENQTQKLKNNFTALLVEIGTRIEPMAGQITTGLSGVMAAFGAGFRQGDFDPLFKFLSEISEKIAATLQTVAKNLPAALKNLDFTGLITSLKGLGGALGEAFEAIFGEIDLSTVQGLHTWIQRVIDGLAALVNVTRGIIDGMRPLFQLIGEGIEKFSEMDASTAETVGNLLGAAKAVNVLAENLPMLTGALYTVAVSGFMNAASTIVGMVTAANIAIPSITGLSAAIGALSGAFGALGIGWMIGSWLNQNEAVQKTAQSMYGLLDVTGTYFGALGRTKEEMEKVDREYEAAVIQHAKLASAQKDTIKATDSTTAKVRSQSEAMASLGVTMDDLKKVFYEASNAIHAIPEKKEIMIGVQADGSSIEKAYGMIIQKFPDGSTRITQAQMTADQTSIDATKKKVDDALPAEKVMQFKTEIDIAKIKADAEIVQASIEWKAKIDIAEIEAATKIMEAAFESVDNTISETSKTIDSMLGVYSTLYQGGYGTSYIETLLRQESERRDAAMALQKTLVEAQIKNLNAKTDAISRNGNVLQIEASGLEPEIEAFMWKILSMIQIRANEEAADLLVGIS